MAEETDPRVAAYFSCIRSAIKAEDRRERNAATPQSVAPPAVRCSEWMDALGAALRYANMASEIMAVSERNPNYLKVKHAADLLTEALIAERSDALEDRRDFLRHQSSDGANPTIIATAVYRAIEEIIHGIYTARNEPWDHATR